MTQRPKLKPTELLPGILGCLTIAAIALGAPLALRTVLTFGFCGFCPGFVAISGFAPRDQVERVVLAIGLSLALDTVVSELMAVQHEFTALRAVAVLTVLIFAKIGFSAYDVPGRLSNWRIERRAERARGELEPWA